MKSQINISKSCILTRAYNSDKYLSEQLKSKGEQKYQKLRLIISDNDWSAKTYIVPKIPELGQLQD